ncbi:MAG: class I SAM-dependent methyltransferase [Alkalibacterium sp.]|nr:class I SAM-dependent methyltransferase [Alkalibacterium sp.]
MLESALNYSHSLLDKAVSSGDIAIDATVGNGHDTIKLAHLVGSSGRVIGFDIQPQAIDTTLKKVTDAGLEEQVYLHHLGHEQVDSLSLEPNSVSAVVFNLGYLPRGDKSIITTPSTTLDAIAKCLPLLKKGGVLLVMVYYGHEGGEREKNSVLTFVESLPQKSFNVLQYGFINQINSPPFLLAVEKK